jgi:hypothetical protein
VAGDPIRVRIVWLLYGDRTLASSRLQGYLVHDELRRRGIESSLLVVPPFAMKDVPWPAELDRPLAEALRGRVAVFQKLAGPRCESFRAALSASGVATVYVHSDLEPENELPLRCDAIVCSSRWLADRYRERGAARVTTIADPAETWRDAADITGTARVPGRIGVAWVGYRRSWPSVAALRCVLKRPRLRQFELQTISNHPDADAAWEPEAARSIVETCDIGAVTTLRDRAALAKSSNRVVSFMAMGLPVVADRIPAYEEVIAEGETGFLCDTPDDWERALLALRSAEVRREIAARARAVVDPHFRISTVADRWLDVLRSLAPHDPCPAQLPPRLASRVRMHAKLAYTREAFARNLPLGDVIAQGRGAVAAAPRARDGTAPFEFMAEVAPLILDRAARAIRRRL